MMTIGRLAELGGVTVRRVRHYHEVGLLAEPERDPSGYRRYGADHAVRLIEVVTLADAGVPLARIDELLDAGPDELATAVAELDRRLRARVDELETTRRRLTALVAGDRLVTAPKVADYLDALRAIGVSDHYIRVERDGWLLLSAIAPDHVPGWIAEKAAFVTDPEYRRICVDHDRCRDLSPTDPKLVDLANRMVAWYAENATTNGFERNVPYLDPAVVAMIEASTIGASQAWRRLATLTRERGAAIPPPPQHSE